MLKELVEYLFQAGAKSTAYQLIAHPTNPDKRVVIGPQGVSEIDTPRVAPISNDVCYSVEDFATRIANDEQLSESIWYDESGAVCYSDDRFRLRSVSVTFSAHPILRNVLGLASQKWFDQKVVNRLLRIDFAGLIESFVTSRFRTLNWESVKRSKQVIAHGKSSIDAEIRSSVTTDEGEMPEAFVVNAPLFADTKYRHFTFPVSIAVDLDTDQCKIGLCLMPGSAEAIVYAQRTAVAGILSSADIRHEMICGKSMIQD